MSAILDHPALEYRPMRHDDLPAIMEIELASYPFPWTRTIFEDCMHAGYSCWVCRRGDRIEGYGILSIGAGESHLLNLCVRKESRGLGTGRKLLRHFIGIARRRNAEVLFLEVRISNGAARHIYQSEGFNELGTRRDYYPDDGGREDALIMALPL